MWWWSSLRHRLDIGWWSLRHRRSIRWWSLRHRRCSWPGPRLVEKILGRLERCSLCAHPDWRRCGRRQWLGRGASRTGHRDGRRTTYIAYVKPNHQHSQRHAPRASVKRWVRVPPRFFVKENMNQSQCSIALANCSGACYAFFRIQVDTGLDW